MSTSFILCEGFTDQILISYYLNNRCGWKHIKSGRNKNVAFIDDDRIEWYSREANSLGIWPVNGNNFSDALVSIIERCKLENDDIRKIIVVTDHDDIDSETKRLEALNGVVSCCLGENVKAFSNGEWTKFEVKDNFSAISEIETLYLLVPISGNGALETFVLNTISEDNIYAKEAIEQARSFIKNFRSVKFLTHNREKVKAELSVSLSIFSPDKAFRTMNEYLKSVNWEKYKSFNIQFQELEKI